MSPANDKKSAVARPQERKFLGFSFTDGPVILRSIAPKAVDRFKERIREITRQAKGVAATFVGPSGFAAFQAEPPSNGRFDE